MGKLTRSNHVAIAKLLRNNVADETLKLKLARVFAAYFEETSDWFDKKRFMEIVNG